MMYEEEEEEEKSYETQMSNNDTCYDVNLKNKSQGPLLEHVLFNRKESLASFSSTENYKLRFFTMSTSLKKNYVHERE